MIPRLANTCAALWLLGLVGMSVFQGLFELGPGSHAFELFASLWLVGGLGYAALGLWCLTHRETAA